MSIMTRNAASVNRVSRHFGFGVLAPAAPTASDREWAAAEFARMEAVREMRSYYGSASFADQLADATAERAEADALEADAIAECFGASEAIRYAEMGLAYA